MTIAEREVQIQRIWRSSFQYELDEALETRLRQSALVGVRAGLEAALVEELEAQLGFGRYVRLPTGKKPPEQQRSGFFQRHVDTSYGYIPDLRVPKLRRGNKERPWQVLVRYQSALQTVMDKACYLYALGLSLRDLQETLYLFLGHVLSRTAVNRVTLAVQSKMDTWRQQPIARTPPILIVDGVWVTILYPTGETWTDRSGHRRQQVRGQERVILAALAVWPAGRYHIIHYEVAEDENADTWNTFFLNLTTRRLDPQAVQMVVNDGTKGLLAALKTFLPKADLQRCTVHKVRGFVRSLRYQDLPDTDPQTGQPLTKEQARQQRRQAMKTQALDIFKAPTKPEAEQRLADFVTKWQPVEPKAVHNFTWGIKRCFTFYQLDPTLHPLVRSTNLLERFFREFRTKSDEIGAFPNEDSCLTVFHLVMVREHAKHDRVNFAKTV
jgi:transposase-like protein